MKDTRGQLERLSDDISRTLEKIASRERYLTDELHYQLNGLKSAHDRRAERKETYRQASVGLVDKSRYLAEVSTLVCIADSNVIIMMRNMIIMMRLLPFLSCFYTFAICSPRTVRNVGKLDS